MIDSVFQEQALILYAIAGLLLVLIGVGVAIWVKLGEIRDELRRRPPR